MLQLKDQTGRVISIESTPSRIVSLVPSLTELLYDLGLGNRLVGRTDYCLHPDDEISNVERIGGTKNIDIQKLSELNPDFVLGNKEENTKAKITKISGIAPTYVSNIQNEKDLLELVRDLSIIFTPIPSPGIGIQIEKAFGQIKEFASTSGIRVKVLYLIWKDPFMVAGTDTYINFMLECMGFENIVFKHSNPTRYPKLTKAEMAKLNADILLLSSEPYPFNNDHLKELSEDLKVPAILVDGEAFSWYGTRILRKLPYIQSIMSDIRKIAR